MDKFPMHRAAEEGDLEGMKHLIELGVSVDSRDDRDHTPLHWAAERGRYEVVQLLISNHCSVNPKNRYGATPMMRAADCVKKDVVRLLLQHGAQVNCADKDEWTPLHYVSSIGSGWADVVQRIVDTGEADVNAATRSGETPLMCAARMGSADATALLLRLGADVHRRGNASKYTALHWASVFGHTRVVQVLLEEEGLDINPQDWNGDTPLHQACRHEQLLVVNQLLIAGANTIIRNSSNETALSVGIRRDKFTPEEITLFVQHGAFLQDCDYALISENPVLKEQILKDVDLCTQLIVNKFHHQSLPALKGNINIAKKLPCIHKFELNARQTRDVEDFVRCDIQTNTFCNVIKARPIVLGFMCVQSLLAYPSGMKRSASPDFCDSNSPFKKPFHM